MTSTPIENTPRRALLCALEGTPCAPPAASLAYANTVPARMATRRYAALRLQQMGSRTEMPLEHDEDTAAWAQAWEETLGELDALPGWMEVSLGETAERTNTARLELRSGTLWRVEAGGGAVSLERPPAEQESSLHWQGLALRSALDIDEHLPLVPAEAALHSGRFDLPLRLLPRLRRECLALAFLSAPFFAASVHLGFEDLMTLPLQAPALASALLERLCLQGLEYGAAAARAGYDGVWVEDLLTSADLLSPRIYERLVFPWNARLLQGLHDMGLKVFLYSTGNVLPRLPWIRQTACDCLAVEEGRKGFQLPIDALAAGLGERIALAGNLDAVLAAHSSDAELQAALGAQRQAAGASARFITSTGSPLPADAPDAALGRFLKLARAAG